MLRYFVTMCLLLGLVSWAIAQRAQPLQFHSDTLAQDEIASGQVPLKKIRERGLEVFSTPFTASVGYGDGPLNSSDRTSPGGRPTLQNNGSFLRVNGLDAQTCMECHSVLSNLTVPFTFGIGGVGGSNSNAIFMPTNIDVADNFNKGFAALDGRFINPPFLFGSGGVELLAKEMTADLLALKERARSQFPGTPVPLITKGVSFGFIQSNGVSFDTSGIEGVDEDLVVRPFGRKGEFISVRAFDIDAMRFHFGMEPIEVVGHGYDADGDGVFNEISEGDLSALSIFNTTLERPRVDPPDSDTQAGEELFRTIGCAGCHVPALYTESRALTYSLPEDPTDPSANVYYEVDLSQDPPGFNMAPRQGLVVPLFSDLKRHDMGQALAESFGSPLDSQFITARLWGVADTAPYLHDGRAHTLEGAILMHGGEAELPRNAFATLPATSRQQLLAFLMTLRTPKNPANDLTSKGTAK